MSGENESILEQLSLENARVLVLHAQLSTAGKPQKHFSQSREDDVLTQLHNAREEVKRCEKLLSAAPTPVPTPAQPATPPPIGAQLSDAKVAALGLPPGIRFTEGLTDDEIATLCLTDRIHYNQGTLSPERARAKLATLSQHELSLLSWTDKIRYGQGKLSTADARTLIATKKPGKKSSGQSLSEQCSAGSTEMADRATGRK